MRIEFLTDLHVVTLGKYQWRLTQSLVVLQDGIKFIVPLGFETDFASVPRLPFVYMIAGGRARKAATVHDYLYTVQAGRDYADDVFYYAMLAEGVKKWIAKLMWVGVRFGGAKRYAR